MDEWAWLVLLIHVLTFSHQVLAQCSGSATNIEATSGAYSIGTFGYPQTGTYGVNLDCNWLIVSTSTGTDDILLTVSISSISAGDNLLIYDGTTTGDTNLYTLGASGATSTATTKVAASGSVLIRFTSDGTTDGSQLGFSVQYMSAAANAEGCTSALIATDTTKYLTSPNFPAEYNTLSACSWSITSQDNCGTLSLNFIFIDMELDCSVDYVSVSYDGNALVKLCPSKDWNPPDYTTTGTTATIGLTSDDSEQKQGFVMSYMRNCPTTAAVTTTAPVTTTVAVTTTAPVTNTQKDGGVDAVGVGVGVGIGVGVPVIGLVVALGLFKAGIIGPGKAAASAISQPGAA